MIYSIFLISNDLSVYADIQKSISPENIQYFDGTGYPSFSKLVNSCVNFSPTEIVIIASSKVRPTQKDVKKTIDLLNQGYSFVALYRFGFFGLHKELFRRIGMMDERFIGGWYEDDDFYIRLTESKMPMYITQEIVYYPSPSAWKHEKAANWFFTKWGDILNTKVINRTIHEQKYDYDLGPSQPINYLPFEKTHIGYSQPHKYVDMTLSQNSIPIFEN